VFGVIDGIGGHAGGEVAAAMAKDIIAQRLTRPLGTPAERVREAIAIANNTIYRRATDCAELAGMACVITLAIVTDGRLTIGHVGDTRLYKLRADGIRKLTRDHSPVGEREDAGELSEADAMRHPHRNEVFRDVGTIFRDKDEQEFVDVIEEPLEADAAILVCSDGLSDMLPGSSIAHIVRQHAGNPEEVVEALVAAANDAGGRDNVTVVYAEMPLFARTMAAGYDRSLTPTEPPNASVYHGTTRNASAAMANPSAAAASALTPAAAAGVAGAATSGAASVPARRVGGVRRIAGAIVSSRMTWFTIGALAGVLGAVGLTAYVARTEARGSQTLIVAPNGTSPFASITAALAAARPGDVVRVEPGSYREQVQLRDGIDLVARVPGTVTIVGPADAATPALAITGGLNVRVAGIRIESQTPVDVGVLITAPAATLELMEMTGQIRHALQLSPASSVTVRGSRIGVVDSLLAVPDDGQATFIDSILTRTAASTDAALTLSPSAHLVLRGNVFAGFGTQILAGVAPAQRAELLAGNIVVPAEEHADVAAPAPAAATRRRGSSSQPRTAGGGR
jgi:serine/threonine protein phosphatase PrpC